MHRAPPTTVSARIATATGRQAQVSNRRGETPVAVKRSTRVSWFSFTGDRGFESTSLQEGVRCEPDLLDHGYIPDVLGGIEPSLVMPPELVIPPELVAEVTYLTWAAASVLRMVY